MLKHIKYTFKIIPLTVLLFSISTAQAGVLDIFKKDTKPTVTPELQNLPYQKWQDTESGRFAHALQYEDKLAKPVPYQFTKGKDRGQEGIDYFEHLCKTEGKDYIYRTAINVETVAQLRSFEIPNSSIAEDLGVQTYLFHPYALEAPMFFDDLYVGQFLKVENQKIDIEKLDYGLKSSNSGIYSAGRTMYTHPYTNFEIKFNNGNIYNFKMDYKKVQNTPDIPNVTDLAKFSIGRSVEKLDKITARYGFTWRGFNRPQDREYGIAGGDLIVIDLEKNEIMAIERTFIKARLSFSPATSINWNGVGCFEQYKPYFSTRVLNFNNKSFKEKTKVIYDAEPLETYLPDFLRKVIINKNN